ncbi:MAG TPA: sulfotransferase [Steroidobacteraceae bacterium]|nr:sulfotransferase [Steroidobacteraceae bacterium]
MSPGQHQLFEALERVGRALRDTPRDPRLLLKRAECLLVLGRASQAREAAAAALEARPTDPRVLDAIGNLLSRAHDQPAALEAFGQAIALAPRTPHFRFNRATVRRFLGDLQGAEEDYDRVISLACHDYEAYLNRSELRLQTREHNHVAELEALLAEGHTDWRGAVALRYALAKEYEDLGEHGQAFVHLERGARLRRQHLRYDVSADVATVEWIIRAHSDSVEPLPPASEADPAAPIFIVGLPRSGSTLVERILGSHSRVTPGGELPHFTLALTRAVRRRAGQPQLGRQELIVHSAGVDFAALGNDYLALVEAGGISASIFTDKMPLNYLYSGLIRRALPHARIVHVRRSPLAACYAMYKTLFKDGYPFSYQLDELGRYYVAYDRLMRHWAAKLPGAILELRYEDLVKDVLGESRRLLEFCGLEWQEACANFHLNERASTTASAAQVRRPLYDSSVSLWQHHRVRLEPLAQQLEAAGIDVD